MTYKGHIRDGQIILDQPADLPEGAEVDVVLRGPTSQSDAEAEGPTFYERFKEFFGACPDLPADMAENHDHYIHGTPKK